MNKASCLVIIPLLFCLTVTLPAWGKKEKGIELQDIYVMDKELEAEGPEAEEPKAEEKIIQAQGTVRLVGNEPFTNIVISAQNTEWYIEKKDEHLLKNLQHQTVIVEGTETVKKLMFASGIPAGERRTLKDIIIISIE